MKSIQIINGLVKERQEIVILDICKIYRKRRKNWIENTTYRYINHAQTLDFRREMETAVI